jgi:hypothetical protein
VSIKKSKSSRVRVVLSMVSVALDFFQDEGFGGVIFLFLEGSSSSLRGVTSPFLCSNFVPPRATSTKSSLYYLGQAVTAQSFNDPYFAQDRRSAQLARSFFLSLQNKTTTTCTYLFDLMHRSL